MLCKNCSNKLNEGSQFCRMCGVRVGVEASPPIVTRPPLPVAPPVVSPPITSLPVRESVAPPVASPAVVEVSPVSTAPPQKNNKKYLIIAASAVIIIIAVFFGVKILIEKKEQERQHEIALAEEQRRQQAERDRLAREEEQRRQQAERSRIAREEEERRRQRQQTTGVYTVISARTYFHTEANAATVRRGYLVETQRVFVERISNGFGYVIYTNEQGTVTRGWLKMEDLRYSN